MHDDDSPVRLIMGCYGSGKSSACCCETMIRAIEMPPCYDGVRRMHATFIRNTSGELISTTIPTWDDWFGGDFAWRRVRQKPVYTYRYKIYDDKGLIELTTLFLALDRPEDLKKLKSLETSMAIINELSEIEKEIFEHVQMRTKRRPSKKRCGEYWGGLLCDSNPPPKSHWMHSLVEIEKPAKHVIYKQPAAILWDGNKYLPNPAAENIKNLTDGYNYYFDRIPGKTKEFIRVFMMGEYGVLRTGKVVYPAYNDDIHSVDHIDIDSDYPIILAVDYGSWHPAMVVMQYVGAQMRVIQEFHGESISIASLFTSVVQPWLIRNNITLDRMICVGDPAKTLGGNLALEELGVRIFDAPTNNIDERIDAVNRLLTRLTPAGQPAFVLSRTGCPALREGFIRYYVFEESNTSAGAIPKDTPKKSVHPHSDLHDDCQYGCLLITHKIVDGKEMDAAQAYYNAERLRADRDRNPATGY
jgi:hypothetical protein